MPGAAADSTGQVGRRIRALRDARGLSLRDLAARSGVSAPMLSQVERGATSPTLAVAAKIAAGLGLALSQLLRLEEGVHVAVSRRADRRAVRTGGHRVEAVTPDLPGQRVSVTLHALKPRARTGGAAGGAPGGAPGAAGAPLHEPGSRETVLVQSGSIMLLLDGTPYTLGEGDAITFDADLPHHIHNPGRGEATFTAVVTAGLRTT